jgi:DNA polymerase-3 subunit alpha
MKVAQIIAGYTMGQADLLRRAMGKKKREIIEKEKTPFLAGAEKQGFSAETAGRIYDMLVPFAEYGFNKSHAAAYSVLSYRTAWLKANFPAEFMAANLTNEIGAADKEKLPEYIEVSRRMGIPIDPPDINRSGHNFTVVDGRIFYGFLGIKGLGDASAEEIINCRQDGPYTGFMDFLERVNIKTVGKKVIELLIKTGAFDSFGQTRQTLVQNLEAAVEYAQNKKADKEFGQASLFEDTDEQAFPEYKFIIHPEMDRTEKLNIEKELIGFYFSGHPLDDYKEPWEKFVKLDLSDMDAAPERDYTLIGILKSLKPYTNKSGKAMAFGALSDYRGEIDLVFFEKTWESCRDKIAEGDKVALKGRLDRQRGKTSLRVDSVLSPERLKIKGELLDYCSSGHPLDDVLEVWEQLVKLDLSKVENADESEYTLVGILSSLRPIVTKAGKAMAFGSLSDYRGEIDLVFFPRAWEYSKDKIAENQCIAIKGKLDKSRDKPSFQVSSVLEMHKLKRKAAKDAEEAAKDGTGPGGSPAGEGGTAGAEAGTEAAALAYREVHIRLHAAAVEREENLFPLRDYLFENSGPCQVFIHVPVPAGETVIRTASQIGGSAEASCIEALSLCTGVAEAWRE